MNPALRCAAYARYSTDRQNPLSTQDQIEKCRQFAAQRGWQFFDQCVYTDEEISGATLDRAGLRALRAAAKSKPRPFDVLLVEDASRLSRKQADVLNLCEELGFSGVRICFVAQGIDSQDRTFQLLLLARGMIDQLALTDTAARVRRGLEGLVRRGLHTGGRCFGYRSRRDPDGVRLEIHPLEADIVRQVFEMYAEGNSLKAIAKKLNAARVTSPRPQAGRLSRSWCPSSVRVLLHNRRYIGEIVWSRKHKVRDPLTGRRVFRTIEGEQPIRGADAPELRVISDELWHRVQDRQELVKRVYEDASKRPGLLRTSAINSRYLFSGLLRCKVCGANLQIIAGRGRNHPNQTYGCPMNFHRGDTVCPNRLRVQRQALEKELLAKLQDQVLREEVVDYILDRFEEEVVHELEKISGEMNQMRARKSELETEARRLAAGLASGIHSPTVMAEIASREREIGDISERLLSSHSSSVHSRIKTLRDQAKMRIRDLRHYLNTDTQLARVFLTKHVEKIEMEPDGRAYVASGRWNLLGDTAIRWDGAEGQS